MDVCKEYHYNLIYFQEECKNIYSLLDDVECKLLNFIHITNDLEARRYSKTLYLNRFNFLNDTAAHCEKVSNQLVVEYTELIDKVEPGLTLHEFEMKYFGGAEEKRVR